jgi:hypothetical protein
VLRRKFEVKNGEEELEKIEKLHFDTGTKGDGPDPFWEKNSTKNNLHFGQFCRFYDKHHIVGSIGCRNLKKLIHF